MKKRRLFLESRRCAKVEVTAPTTGHAITVDPQRDALIGGDLDEELCRLPALMGWYCQLRDNAKTEEDDAKHEELNTYEDLYKMFSAQKEETKKQKMTETAIKMAVNAHSAMRAAYRKRMDAEAKLRLLQSAVDMIDAKRWSIQSLVKLRISECGVKDSI